MESKEKLTIESRRAIAATIGMRSTFSGDGIDGVLKELESDIYYFNGLVDCKLVLVYRKNGLGPSVIDEYMFRTIKELKERIPKFKLFILAEKI